MQLVCGISNRQTYEMTWERIDLETDGLIPIYSSIVGIHDQTNYDIETPTGGGLEYFNLVVTNYSVTSSFYKFEFLLKAILLDLANLLVNLHYRS